MCNNDTKANLPAQSEEFFFEQVVTVAVRPAAVAQNQNRGGIWIEEMPEPVPPPPQVVAYKGGRFMGVPDGNVAFVQLDIVDSVGNGLPCCQVGVVVAIDFRGFPVFAQDCLTPRQQPQGFLLFGVNAEDGIVFHVPKQGNEEKDYPELFLTVRTLSDEQFFWRFSLSITVFLEYPLDGTVGHFQPVLCEQMAFDVPET